MARPSTWLPVVTMMGASLLSYIDRQTLAVLAPTILRDTGLSVQQYAIIVSCFSLFYMAGNPLWGYWLDRLGLRRGMTLSVSLWTAASALHATLSGFWGFSAARALLGFGEGATFPGGLRTAMDSLPPHRQSRGIALAYSGGSLGAIVTPLLVTPIAVSWGWRAAFVCTGVFGAAWLLLWRFVSQPSRLPQRHHEAQATPLPRLTEGRFWALVFGYALGAIPLSYVLYIAPLYLGKVLHYSQSDLGKVLWIPPLGWEVGYFFWGWVADRFAMADPRPTRFFVLLAVLSLPLALTPQAGAGAAVLALLFFAMFAAAGFVVFSLRSGAMSYPREHTGLVAGIGAGSWSALVAIVMPLFGSMFDRGLYAESFLLVSLIPLAGAAGWWYAGRTTSGSAVTASSPFS
ncbi:MAG: MFS transporter [Bryobacteraceae bacterium]